MYYGNFQYLHPTDLEWMSEHKLDNAAAIYGDELLYNSSFCCPSLFKICNFIYLIREAGPVMDDLVLKGNYSPNNAYLYYSFRLQRIREMITKTPNYIFLTWDSLIDGGLKKIEEYLSLKEPLEVPKKIKDVEGEWPVSDLIRSQLKKKAQESYENHLYNIKKLI